MRACRCLCQRQVLGELNLRERANRDAIAQWEGISDPEAVDDIMMIKNRGLSQQGSKAGLEELAAYCRKNNLNDPMHLAYVEAMLDIDSLFAHAAFEIITGNTDLANVRYYKVPGENGNYCSTIWTWRCSTWTAGPGHLFWAMRAAPSDSCIWSCSRP